MPRIEEAPGPFPGDGADPRWQDEMARALRDPAALRAALRLPPLAPEEQAAADRATADFPVFVPPGYLSRMRPGDPDDPLLLQVLPRSGELQAPAGFRADPLDEAAHLAAPGLVRKYPGRALLVTTGVCAVHCRYCFRRHFDYQEGVWRQALEAVRADPTIRELLLSGGDPLAMAPGPFAELVRAADAIPHVRRLRVHTRLPIVLPARVDRALVELLGGLRARPVVVVHANHARELGGDVDQALGRLAGAGALLLNQSVLLRGVNDSVAALRDLSEALVEAGVAPYYLHLLDPVLGAAHFEVPEDEARGLLEQLRASAPGYAVPRLVREVPGAGAKVPV